MTGIDGAPAIALSDYVNDQFDQALSWESLDRMVDAARSAGLKVVLKEIQHVDDAESAVAHGVDAIELSNHGGRQIDRTLARCRWWRASVTLSVPASH